MPVRRAAVFVLFAAALGLTACGQTERPKAALADCLVSEAGSAGPAPACTVKSKKWVPGDDEVDGYYQLCVTTPGGLACEHVGADLYNASVPGRPFTGEVG